MFDNAFNLVTITAVSLIMTTILLMFTILPEHPKSMFSASFMFNFAQSLGCPSILIIGNKNIRRSLKRIVSVNVEWYNEKITSDVHVKIRNNQVSPRLEKY